ncbi:MAG: glycosyltransferase family 2 protein [bacterium]|nr:glycosyltransferase family 2 protein [bacterium]
MEYYFLSIVIPALNEEKYLPACLSSLNSQDYPKDKYEVIVVNNDSTDRTAEIATEMGARVVSCHEKGVAAVRQDGYEQAKGEIFVGTDSDTVQPTDWLSRINELFQSDPSLIAITGGAEFNSNSLLNQFLAKELFPINLQIMFALGKQSLSGFNFSVRRDAFEQVGGFDTSLASAEDVDLGVRLGKIGKVKFIRSLVVTTSSRRIDASRVKFFTHHLRNVIKFMILGQKPESFENIR